MKPLKPNAALQFQFNVIQTRLLHPTVQTKL